MSELIKKYKYRNTLIVMIYFILFIFLQKTHNLYLLSIYFFIATGILYKYLCSLGTISRNSIRLFSVMLFLVPRVYFCSRTSKHAIYCIYR